MDRETETNLRVWTVEKKGKTATLGLSKWLNLRRPGGNYDRNLLALCRSWKGTSKWKSKFIGMAVIALASLSVPFHCKEKLRFEEQRTVS